MFQVYIYMCFSSTIGICTSPLRVVADLDRRICFLQSRSVCSGPTQSVQRQPNISDASLTTYPSAWFCMYSLNAEDVW